MRPEMTGPSADDPARARRAAHWRSTRRVTGALMLVWGTVTFGVAYNARTLAFDFFGWPFSFWVGAQGALLVYLVLVAVYAWAMRRLDEAHELDELG
jgi:putative solute:sodium symporter small subunit